MTWWRPPPTPGNLTGINAALNKKYPGIWVQGEGKALYIPAGRSVQVISPSCQAGIALWDVVFDISGTLQEPQPQFSQPGRLQSLGYHLCVRLQLLRPTHHYSTRDPPWPHPRPTFPGCLVISLNARCAASHGPRTLSGNLAISLAVLQGQKLVH